MKKRFFAIFAAVALLRGGASVALNSYNSSTSEIDPLLKANIEALTQQTGTGDLDNGNDNKKTSYQTWTHCNGWTLRPARHTKVEEKRCSVYYCKFD